MNSNDLLELEKQQKLEKQRQRKEKHRQNVYSLHEMFPAHDLATLSAFYLQAGKDVDKAISLILSTSSSAAAEAEVTSCANTPVNDTPSLASLRADRRITTLMALFPWKTFSEQDVYKVLMQCQEDINVAMMVLMDMRDDMMQRQRREEEQIKQIQMDDMEQVDQLDFSEEQENDLVHFSQVLTTLASLDNEDDYSDNSDDDGNRDNENSSEPSQNTQEDESLEEAQIDMNDIDTQEFLIGSDTSSIDAAFATSMEYEQHQITVDQLEKLVKEQEELEHQIAKMLQEELKTRELVQQLLNDELDKQELFNRQVIYKNFTRREDSDKYKQSVKISNQDWSYSNSDGISQELKELLVDSEFHSNERRYLSQVNTMLSSLAGRRDIHVQSVLSEELARNFKEKLRQIRRCKPDADIQFAFHGTSEDNVANILQAGLLMPGAKGFKHATDTGWYGRGIYLSPNASLSLSYCRGGGKLLVCAVIPGRVYQCSNLMRGKGCVRGFDSHMSPNGDEIILFSSSQVLPCFVIHFLPPKHYYYFHTNSTLSELEFKNGTSQRSIREQYMKRWRGGQYAKAARLQEQKNEKVAARFRKKNNAHTRRINSQKRLQLQPQNNMPPVP